MNDKQQLAAMGEHLSEQLPMCMAKRIEELEAQVRVMAELLRDLREGAEIHLHNCTVCKNADGIANWTSKLERIDAALAGKLPDPTAPEDWQLIGYRNHSAPNGLRRFMTPKQYSKQTDGIKKWYEPVYGAPVPEGWQLVPVEPTEEMLDAGYFTNHGANRGIYRAMLAAAPKPETK